MTFSETTLDVANTQLIVRPGAHSSVSAFMREFQRLPAPSVRALSGRFRCELVGPWWLRTISWSGLLPFGLPHVWGKTFSGLEPAYNLSERGGLLERALPMAPSQGSSAVDGRPCITLRYTRESPLLVRRVSEELRVWDDRRMLGMTRFDLPGLRSFVVPFLLVRA